MNAQELSWLALWGATALYAIAMVASSIHVARVADAKVAAKKQRALVGAGGAAAAAAGDAGSGDEAPDGPGASATPQGRSGASATPQGRSGASATGIAPVRGRARGIARSATLMGAVLQGVGVVARGIEAGHVPWSTMYEYTITGTWVAVVVLLVVQMRRDVAYLAPGVTGFATLALGLALTVLYRASTGLQPALQSFWLVIHVSIAIIATGIFTVAAVATVLQLARDYRDSGTAWLQRVRWLEATPSPARLEALAFRLHAVGFVLWTFTVMAGAVWAEHAWGRYWGWDPKEVWSFVIWVLYAAYLHARTTQGWAGRRSAVLALVGFLALIMNFTVVNLVFQGLHSYAGVNG